MRPGWKFRAKSIVPANIHGDGNAGDITPTVYAIKFIKPGKRRTRWAFQGNMMSRCRKTK